MRQPTQHAASERSRIDSRPAPVRTGGRLLFLTLMALLASACGSRDAGPTGPGPRAPDPNLPDIPAADGPLDLRVSYPRDSGYVATRGRTFIFGSAGNGEARVWINAEEVEVQRNGAFLAFLPVPLDGVYRLRATLEDRTQTVEVPVRLPEPPPEPGGAPTIVAGSLSPSGGWVARPGEQIEVSFRGTAGGRAWLVLPEGRVPLVEEVDGGGGATDFEVAPGEDAAEETGLSTYHGFFTARRITSADTTTAWPSLTGEPRPSLPREPLFAERERSAGAVGEALGGVPEADRAVREAPGGTGAAVVLEVNGQTVARPLPVNLTLAEPSRPRIGAGWDLDPPEENGDGRIIARPGPGGGPYHYTWRNGVELELTGERNGIYRVRLTDDLHAWTPAGDVRLRAMGTPPPTSRVGTVRMDPQPGWIDVHLALDRRLPYLVQEGERSVTLFVYGATSRTNFLQHGRVDPYIERGEWSQPSDRLFRLDLHLAGLPWGWEVFYGEGNDLVLRLNRPPEMDPEEPLRGLTIGVDAGHGGEDRYTMGPTGLTEADANLGIARALAERLEDRGATVVMSRSSDATVSLVERTELARREDVDLWVSVHNNAFPDGVNPWENNGTSVYYNHPNSAALAWSIQDALLEEMGLRDLGVGRADLHQARFSWAPAVLTENAFMMIPEQEAFLASPEGRERIAEAHVRGIERWLRGLVGGADQ